MYEVRQSVGEDIHLFAVVGMYPWPMNSQNEHYVG